MNPSKIICLGLNYADHAVEQGKTAPDYPMMFAKGPNSLAGDGDVTPYPRGVEQYDYEVELAFIMGRRARRVSIEDAYAHVAKGPVTEAYQNVMLALEYVDGKEQPDITSGVFGYDHVKPRKLVGEMLAEIRRLGSVLQALGPGTMELDLDGRILRASVGACEVLGRTESQLVGEMVTSLCRDRDKQTLETLVQELAKTSFPERCRAVVQFLNLQLPVLLCSIIERATCTGIYLIMESQGAPVADQP